MKWAGKINSWAWREHVKILRSDKWKETFRTQYDCLHFGYEESQRKLEEIGREEVNKYGMYIKFYCTPVNSI